MFTLHGILLSLWKVSTISVPVAPSCISVPPHTPVCWDAPVTIVLSPPFLRSERTRKYKILSFRLWRLQEAHLLKIMLDLHWILICVSCISLYTLTGMLGFPGAVTDLGISISGEIPPTIQLVLGIHEVRMIFIRQQLGCDNHSYWVLRVNSLKRTNSPFSVQLW